MVFVWRLVLRIVFGCFKGIVLVMLKFNVIWLISDWLCESIFNILSYGLEFDLDGCWVLDFFVGIGVFGFEVMS